jgi:toxin-antitoxin system PIN domain toxin
MLLLDINVWLALTFDVHVHHQSAKTWFDSLTDEVCFFCRMTQQGFLRLATNQKIYGPDTLTLSEAWDQFDAFMGDPRVSFVAEPAGMESRWRSFTTGQSFSTKIWNDAYLAAFAATAGHELITFDRGVSRYVGVRYQILP